MIPYKHTIYVYVCTYDINQLFSMSNSSTGPDRSGPFDRCGQVQAADLLNQAHLMSLSVPKWWVLWSSLKPNPEGGPREGLHPFSNGHGVFFFWFRVHAKLPTSDISMSIHYISLHTVHIIYVYIYICIYIYKYIVYIYMILWNMHACMDR